MLTWLKEGDALQWTTVPAPSATYTQTIGDVELLEAHFDAFSRQLRALQTEVAAATDGSSEARQQAAGAAAAAAALEQQVG